MHDELNINYRNFCGQSINEIRTQSTIHFSNVGSRKSNRENDLLFVMYVHQHMNYTHSVEMHIYQRNKQFDTVNDIPSTRSTIKNHFPSQRIPSFTQNFYTN